MGKLSTEERIKRIEQAPNDVQTMVAKAFIRDDIDDEDIQYLFNEMPLDEMNEDGVVIENINAELPEGIGATGFTKRTTKPVNNKHYITRSAGGYSNCIKGNPMDPNANVLANCVGYASGRYNEIIDLVRGLNECRYTNLICNAVGFYERALEASLQVGNKPRKGAIMCWGGGSSGAGHVEVVEEVINDNEVFTSASDYGSTTFYNARRNNNNGRWGLASSFYFRGFIYLPDDVYKAIDDTSPTSSSASSTSSDLKIGDYVKITGYGNGSSCGDSNRAVPGYEGTITNIYEGRPFPYEVSDEEGVLGYYPAEALSK